MEGHDQKKFTALRAGSVPPIFALDRCSLPPTFKFVPAPLTVRPQWYWTLPKIHKNGQKQRRKLQLTASHSKFIDLILTHHQHNSKNFNDIRRPRASVETQEAEKSNATDESRYVIPAGKSWWRVTEARACLGSRCWGADSVNRIKRPVAICCSVLLSAEFCIQYQLSH